MIFKLLLVIYIVGLILTALLMEAMLRSRTYQRSSDQLLAERVAQAFASLLWPGLVISVVWRNLNKKRIVK